MHTADVIAFVLLCVAAVVAVVERGWVLALVAAGLAFYLLPLAFQLH